MKRIFVLLLLASMLLAGCSTPGVDQNENLPSTDISSSASQQEPVVNEPGADISESETNKEQTVQVNDTTPVEVRFSAADGTELQGMYYPPVYSGAPVVVLMHQYNLNYHEWDTIALWLQNAGELQTGKPVMHLMKPAAQDEPFDLAQDEPFDLAQDTPFGLAQDTPFGLAQDEPFDLAQDTPFGQAQDEPWQDASWFPELPEDFSVGVFAFTFRGCDNGCQEMDRDNWILDAQAALEKAASMPEVDAGRIVTIGTSIGADGAADACALSTPKSSLRCVGVFSLSPGSYLNMEYAEAARILADVKIPTTCLASKGDTRSAEACKSFSGNSYHANLESGYEHGIEMVNPDRPTNILVLIRDFLFDEVL